MNIEKIEQFLNKKVLMGVLILLSSVLCVYFIAKTVNEIDSDHGVSNMGQNTISFNGVGEISAVPDISTISFTVRKDSKVVADAQSFVSTKVADALKMLKSNGIADKDIKTDSYSSNPNYEYGAPTPVSMPCRMDYCPPYGGKQTISGYQVSQTVEIKIRDISKVSAIEKGLADLGINETYGPNFAIDNEDTLKTEARQKAIADAKSKADELAKELHIHLGHIVNFSENGGGYPIMYAKGMSADSGSAPETMPNLPTGENKITSNVTITYEIR